MNKFKAFVGQKQIKMASAESLFEKMMLPPGIVSPFGLLNNRSADIQVYFDEEIVSEDRMSFIQIRIKKQFLFKRRICLYFWKV